MGRVGLEAPTIAIDCSNVSPGGSQSNNHNSELPIVCGVLSLSKHLHLRTFKLPSNLSSTRIIHTFTWPTETFDFRDFSPVLDFLAVELVAAAEVEVELTLAVF